ncbi:hypothetical protein [Paraburkholderia rhizosphaerae]|uniref:hypothetical protein n=1 Tax=Paraburkholderia rhizosphaerae TaxID=480658 RepID=UPI001416FB98|nr:hypothetical protein [Paraburkholderia rhizosphaerae]
MTEKEGSRAFIIWLLLTAEVAVECHLLLAQRRWKNLRKCGPRRLAHTHAQACRKAHCAPARPGKYRIEKGGFYSNRNRRPGSNTGYFMTTKGGDYIGNRTVTPL